MTLPVIHLLASGGARRRRARAHASSTRARASLDEWRELRALLGQARSIDYAQRRGARVRRARQETLCAIFPPSDARDALMFLPDYVISRDR